MAAVLVSRSMAMDPSGPPAAMVEESSALSPRAAYLARDTSPSEGYSLPAALSYGLADAEDRDAEGQVFKFHKWKAANKRRHRHEQTESHEGHT
jgi:hypothetical protein